MSHRLGSISTLAALLLVAGKHCLVGPDCTSGTCSGGTCQ